MSQAELQLLCVGFPCSGEKRFFCNLAKRSLVSFWCWLPTCKGYISSYWELGRLHPTPLLGCPSERVLHILTGLSFGDGGPTEILLVFQGTKPKERSYATGHTEPVVRTWRPERCSEPENDYSQSHPVFPTRPLILTLHTQHTHTYISPSGTPGSAQNVLADLTTVQLTEAAEAPAEKWGGGP